MVLQVAEIKRIHQENSPDHFNGDEKKIVQLSLDGVSESKSTSISLDVYSVKFEGCRDIFPIRIIRPLSKHPIDQQEQLSLVISDVLRNNLEISDFIADNPKRSFLRLALQHSAKFACEYCFACGTSYTAPSQESNVKLIEDIECQKKHINDQLKSLVNSNDNAKIESLHGILNNLEEAQKIAKKQKKTSQIVWPASSSKGEPRTKEKILEIVVRIEGGEELESIEKKGIKGRSLLLDIDNFDFVISIPTEYMHLLSLGVVKRLLELTFSCGEVRSRNIKTPLASPDKFNELMKVIKMFHEFSRRARKLDLSVMKAQELRNVCIFYFILVVKCLNNQKEIKIWEMLAFMIRACVLPDIEFNNVNKSHITYCQKQFYVLFEQLYGVKNCAYSVHVLPSHLLDMRAKGPLTETSAFKFEAFYAELRKSFQPGTVSVLKQMLQTVLLKRILTHHVCQETIFYKEKDSAMECNSLIYVYVNNAHIIYKIDKVEKQYLICRQLGNHQTEFPYTTMLNWSSVGVYRKGGLSSINVNVPKNEIAGKVMQVDKYLITCPKNVLREK